MIPMRKSFPEKNSGFRSAPIGSTLLTFLWILAQTINHLTIARFSWAQQCARRAACSKRQLHRGRAWLAYRWRPAGSYEHMRRPGLGSGRRSMFNAWHRFEIVVRPRLLPLANYALVRAGPASRDQR